MTLDDFLARMPKVELHCHLLGTVRRATFTELARRAKAPISDEEMAAFYTRGEKPVGVLRVLRALDAWLLRTPDDFHRLTYEYLQDAAAHQVRHAEFFWNPTGTAQVGGLPYAQALAGIRRAMADARTDFGISGRLIAAIDREASPEAALEMVQWVIARPCEEVVGIGPRRRWASRRATSTGCWPWACCSRWPRQELPRPLRRWLPPPSPRCLRRSPARKSGPSATARPTRWPASSPPSWGCAASR